MLSKNYKEIKTEHLVNYKFLITIYLVIHLEKFKLFHKNSQEQLNQFLEVDKNNINYKKEK